MIGKRLNRTLPLACLILLAACGSVLGQTKPSEDQQAKEKDVRRLLSLMKAGEASAQISAQMFSTMRQSMRQQIPQEVWDELMTEFQAEFSPERVIELNVPIYAKHYTHDEIKQLIAFYESPLGKKVILVAPLIMREAYEVGVMHGRQVMERIYEKLRSKGYKPPVS